MPPRASDGATTTAARVRRPTGVWQTVRVVYVCANSVWSVSMTGGLQGDGRRSIKKRLCWCKMRVQYGACTRTRMMIKTLCVGLVYPSIFNNASLLKRRRRVAGDAARLSEAKKRI